MIVTFEDFTPELDPAQIKVAYQIGGLIKKKYRGALNAVSSTTIIKGYRENLNYTISPPLLRQMINFARHEGCLICANGKGYFYPNNREEFELYQKSLLQRIGSQVQMLNALQASNSFVQPKFFSLHEGSTSK